MDSQSEQWFTSNTKLEYPFSSEVGITEEPTLDFHSYVVDARVVCRDFADKTPVLYGISRSGDVLTAAVKWSGGAALTLLPANIQRTDFGDWITLYYIFNDSAVNDNLQLTLVVHKSILDELTDSESWTLDEVPFVSKCIEYLPSRVSTLGAAPVFGEDKTETEEAMLGGIKLAEGYNIKLTVSEEETGIFSGLNEQDIIRRPKIITIDAIPGEGAGQKPKICRGELGGVLTINGAGPDSNGNLSLTSDNCISVNRADANEVSIDNHCTECCGCENYVGVYELMRKLVERGAALKAHYDTLASRIDDIISRWNSLTEGEEVKVAVRAFPRHGWIASIQYAVFNATETTFTGIRFDTDITYAAPWSLVDGSGYINTFDNKNTPAQPVRSEDTLTYESDLAIFGSGRLILWSYEIFVPEHAARSATAPMMLGHTVTVGSGDDVEIKELTTSVYLKPHQNR